MPARFVLRSGVFALAWVLLTSLPSSPVAAARGVLLRFGPNYQLSAIKEELNKVESNGRVAARFSIEVSTLDKDPVQNVLIDWTVENGAGGSGAENVEVHATKTDAQGNSRAELTSKTAGTFVVKAAWKDQVQESSVEFVESKPLFFEEPWIEYLVDSNNLPEMKLGQEVQGGHTGGVITYSSSDPAIASFADAKKPDITLKKVGAVMITATEQGTEQFSDKRASYSLEVSSGDPDQISFHVDFGEDVVSLGKKRIYVKAKPGSSVVLSVDGGNDTNKTVPDYAGFHFEFPVSSPGEFINVKVEDEKNKATGTIEKALWVRPYTMHAQPVIYEDGTVGAKITADKLENFGHYECPKNWVPSQGNDEKCETEIRMSSGKYPEIEVMPEYKVSPKAKKIVVSETKFGCIGLESFAGEKGPVCKKLQVDNSVQVPVEDRANLELSLHWSGKDAAATEAKNIPLFTDSTEQFDCGSPISELMCAMVNIDGDKLQRWEIALLGTSCRVPCFENVLKHSFEMLSGPIEKEQGQHHTAIKENAMGHSSGSEVTDSESAILKQPLPGSAEKKQTSSFVFDIESFKTFSTKNIELEKKVSEEGLFEFTGVESGGCGLYPDSFVFFDISDKNEVSVFQLEDVLVGDMMDFFVNGVLVFRTFKSDIYFHNSLEQQFYLGHGGIVMTPVNLDLKPYLKNGTNTMQVNQFIGDSSYYHLALKIRAEPFRLDLSTKHH